MLKKVSVIVPVFNVEPYISECIDSIISQSYKALEIIFVNAGSTDNSVALIKRAMFRDHRVRLINQKINNGLGGSRNEGLQHATGEYVLFVDSDDWISPDMIQSLVRALEEHGADYAFGAVEGYDAVAGRYNGHEYPFHSMVARKKALAGPIDLANSPEMLTDMYPSAWIGLRRRAKITETGADFPLDRVAEDHRFHYLYGFQSTKAIYVDKAFYKHRRNRAGQLSLEQSARALGVIDTINENMEIFDRFLPARKARAAKVKIALRLIFEKLGQFHPENETGEIFFDRARKILSQFGRDELYLYADSFITHDHLNQILGVTKDLVAKTLARGQTFISRHVDGNGDWTDVSLLFRRPLDLSFGELVLLADIKAPTSISLRLALLCGSTIHSDDDEANVSEYRQTFSPGSNVVVLQTEEFSVLRGQPSMEQVKRILFGGQMEQGAIDLRLAFLGPDGLTKDIVGLAENNKTKQANQKAGRITVDSGERRQVAPFAERIRSRVSTLAARLSRLLRGRIVVPAKSGEIVVAIERLRSQIATIELRLNGEVESANSKLNQVFDVNCNIDQRLAIIDTKLHESRPGSTARRGQASPAGETVGGRVQQLEGTNETTAIGAKLSQILTMLRMLDNRVQQIETTRNEAVPIAKLGRISRDARGR